jgi:hypothetical protein
VLLHRMARRESGSSVAARREKAMLRVGGLRVSEVIYNRIAILRAERAVPAYRDRHEVGVLRAVSGLTAR